MLTRPHRFWDPSFWLAMLTSYPSSASPSASQKTLLDVVAGWLGWSGNSRLVLPAGCQLSDFLATGVCKLQFDLSALFTGKNITLRLVVRRCGNSASNVPEVLVDCVGADCAGIINAYNYQLCRQDTDCTGSVGGAPQVCRVLSSYVTSDPVGGALWNVGAADTCSNSAVFIYDGLHLLSQLGGRGAVPAGPDPQVGICQPQLEQLRNLQSWVNAQSVTRTNSAANATTGVMPVANRTSIQEVSLPSLQGYRSGSTESSSGPCAISLAPVSPPVLVPSSSSKVSSNNSNFAELLTLDCMGAVHVLQAHPFGRSDVSIGGSSQIIYGFLRDAVLNRVKCHCPQLPAGTLNRLYTLNVQNVLLGMQALPADIQASLAANCPDIKISLGNISSWLQAVLPRKCLST